jgi:hypothetical protein
MPVWEGNPNSGQPVLLEAMISKLPENSEILAAFDADAAGRALVQLARGAVRRVANQKERMDLIFQSHLPEREGEDWNQVLQTLTCQRANRQGKTNSCPA